MNWLVKAFIGFIEWLGGEKNGSPYSFNIGKESAEKIDELLQYMQVLRDLPNNESLTPENLTWPEVP